MLKFSANLSMLFTELPLLARFQAARDTGFQAVEMQFPYEAALPELQAARERAGVEVVLINVPAGDLMQGGDGLASVPGREAAFHAAVEQALGYAAGLGVRCVNVLAGRLAEGVARAAAHDTLAANLRHAAERFATIGVKVTCEAINPFDMPRFLLNTSADMLAMLDRVSHPNLAMQVDLYHLARMGEDLPTLLRQHWPQIGHLQFADVPGRGAPGSGELDFQALFGLIAALPYQGWTGAEYKPGMASADSLGWFAAYREPA